MLSYEVVKGIILDELRAKGYAPNPADVSVAVNRIIEHATEVLEKDVDAKVAAFATKPSTPVVQAPPSK